MGDYSQGTPVFAPDGSVHSIPDAQLQDAMKAGGKLAVQMNAPDGSLRYVPHDQVAAAQAAGGKVNLTQGTTDAPKPAEGFWHSLGSVFGLTPEAKQAAEQRAAGMSPVQEALAATKPPNPVDLVKNAASAVSSEFQKGSQEGRQSLDSLKQGDIKGFLAHQIGQVGHAAAAVAAPLAGNNLSKAGEQLGQGDVSGAAGTTVGVGAPFIVPAVGKGAVKAAGVTADVITAASKAAAFASPELVGMVHPQLGFGLKLLNKAAKVIEKLGPQQSGGLSDIVDTQHAKITSLQSQLSDALSKANALPPEGPTAKITDVPDLRVQPGQQAPQNLLEARKAAFMAARGVQGEFPVNGPEAPQLAQMKDVMGNVQIRPQGAMDAQPAVLRATGQPQSTGRVTPNMEIYNEPIQPPVSIKPPTLLEQLRQWDQIRQIHSQLEDQIGKGQDELQQWMEDHNQQTPGGKSTAAKTAKARFDAARAKAVPGAVDEPRVPTSDSDMEELLMKSVQAAKAKKAMSAKAGD